MDEKGATFLCDLISSEESSPPPPPSTLPVYLIMVSGGIPGAMLRLLPDGTRLGRSADNSYQIGEVSVSRHHALIASDPHGGVRLTDLGSTNGTFLNGRKLPRNTPVRLQDGDRIQLGSRIVLKFVRLDPSDEQFQREMFERTVRDALTGFYNRAYFLDQVGPLAEFGAVRGLGLALLLLDIDHFKRINDTYGHDAGDAVLREVANVLRESTRPEDLVARYGGEEFIVALPVAAPDQATDRAERIRANLAARRIIVPPAVVRMTASLGLAFAPAGRLQTTAALISAADRCMYQAKRAGRDRVVFGREAPALRPEPEPADLR